jgi:pSer/pThr/pTyr-binding forkhead associated (FHA) protein
MKLKMMIQKESETKATNYELSGEQFTIGRINRDIVLEGNRVSRKHAVISALNHDTTLVIRDCGSVNGTFVNGVRSEVTQLKVGDTIKIGTYLIRILEISTETSTMKAETQNIGIEDFVSNSWEQNWFCLPKGEQKKFEAYLNRDKTQGE